MQNESELRKMLNILASGHNVNVEIMFYHIMQLHILASVMCNDRNIPALNDHCTV